MINNAVSYLPRQDAIQERPQLLHAPPRGPLNFLTCLRIYGLSVALLARDLWHKVYADGLGQRDFWTLWPDVPAYKRELSVQLAGQSWI